MDFNEDPAIEWVTGWDIWQWILWAGLLCVAIAFFFSLRWLNEVRSGDYGDVDTTAVGTVVGVTIVVGTIAGLVAAIGIPTALMRHTEVHGNVLWIVIPLLLLAGALGIGASVSTGAIRWVRAAGAIALGWGTIYGVIVDALNRAAASVPMGVGAFLLLLVGGAAFFFVASSRR